MFKLARSLLHLLGLMQPLPPSEAQNLPLEFVTLTTTVGQIPVAGYSDILSRFYADAPCKDILQDWYISKVEARKYKTGLEHELIIVTLRRNPHTTQGAKGDLEELLVVLERMQGSRALRRKAKRRAELWLNKEYENSQEFKVDVTKTLPDRLGTSVSADSSSSSLDASVKTVQGQRAARDVISLVDTVPTNAELLTTLHLVAPPAATGDAAPSLPTPSASSVPSSTSSPIHQTAGSPQTLPDCQPKPLYLYELVLFALLVHNNGALYKLCKKNCYWFTGMMIHLIRRYTNCQMALVQGKNTKVMPGDRDLQHFTISDMGKFRGVFHIIKTPSNTTLDRLIEVFKNNRAEYHQKVASGTAKPNSYQEETKREKARADRYQEEKEQERVEKEREKAEKEREKAEKEREKAEKEREKAEKEREKARADELQRKLHEMEQRFAKQAVQLA